MPTLTDHKAPNQDYDAPGNADSSPLGTHDDLGVDSDTAAREARDLENLYNSSPDTDTPEAGPHSKASAADRAGLREQEENPEPPDEPNDDMLGKGFTGRKNRLYARTLARMVTKRRSLVAGGVLGILFGGGIGVFITGIVPAQAYNYSQILLNASKNHQNSRTITLGRLYRYMRTGSVGSTRLNALEYRIYPKMIASLGKTGANVLTEGLTGQIRAVSLDPSKLGDMRGMSREEMGKYVAKQYDIKPSKVYVGSNGGNIRFSMQDLPLKKRELLLKDIVRQSGAGRVNSFIQMRLLRKYYGVPSMFHPLQRLASSADAKTLELLRKSKSFRELEKNRTAKIAARSQAAKARIASIKAKAAGAAGAATGILLAQGALCIAYDIAKEADILNQENFRDPAVKSGADAQAVGEQVAASSPDVTKENIEGFVDNMTDPATKTTPFDSAAVRALEGKPGGVPVDPALKAAFSLENAASAFLKNLQNNFKADSVCSVGGQIVGGIVGVAQLIIGPGGWVLKGLTTAGSVAGTQIMMTYIQSTIPRLLAEEPPIGIPHQGASGGAFDAYGARAGANDIAMSSAGVAIDQKTALLRQKQWLAEEKIAWSHQSFLARVFNPYDYRSLAGRFVNEQSPSVAVQASKTASTFAALPGSLLRLPDWAIPQSKVSAEEASFNWGFPTFDLSNAVLNDPRYADPYDNADKAATILDASGTQYVDRARVCFGANIVKESFDGAMVWAVRADTKPNPYSPEYEAADCGQQTSDNWNRVSAFVNSSMAMEAENCRLGDAESCGRVGQDSPVGSPTSSPVIASQPKALDSTQLFASSADIACYDDPSTSQTETRDLGIHDGYTKGVKTPIRLCAVGGFKSTSAESNGGYGIVGANGDVIINSRVSKNVTELFLAAKTDKTAGANGLVLSAASSFRTFAHQEALCNKDAACRKGIGTYVAPPGYSNHQMGLAIDFAGTDVKADASSCTSGRATDPTSPVWRWLEKNAARFGYRQYMRESWHWDPMSGSSRCGGAGV